MEEAVKRVLVFELGNGQRLAVRSCANHVMPTENLMEHNPIEEAANAKP